jgi:hypothetical protein
MMSQQAEQEQALKSDIAQESAENCTEEELSAITGGGSENASQGAKTGAVAGVWIGGVGAANEIAKLAVEKKAMPFKQAAVYLAGSTLGGAALGSAIGASIGATFPDHRGSRNAQHGVQPT